MADKPPRTTTDGGNGNGVVLFSTGATGNVVEGNYVGTDATGTVAGVVCSAVAGVSA